MPTILIVDDEKNIRDTLATYVQSLGYTVETASDGETGWRLLGAKHFDLVFLDVRMPGMDGLACLRRIRAHQPEVPVVLMTAYATVPQAVEAMRLGACEYLMKPFAPDDVRLLIRRILDSQSICDGSAAATGHPETTQVDGPKDDPGHPSSQAGPEPALPLREIERRCIEQAIETSPTLGIAAARLGIDPATLWRKRKRYGME